MEKNKTKRFEELDALRGIAALMVVFFHFSMKRDDYNSFLKLGVVGVDLFFIISGFVIFMSLQKVSNSKDFIINRISRLYPTYWASVTLTFILIICYGIFNGNVYPQNIVFNYVGNMTMFQFYLRIPDIDGPYWTMIIEMIFYIAILSLYQLRLLKYLNIIGIVLCLIIVLLTHFFYDVFIVKHFISAVPLLQFIPLFMAGTIFYKIYIEKTKLPLYYCIVTCCLICQMALFNFAGQTRYFITFNEYCLMLVLFFILFIFFVNNKLKFIVNKISLFFGKISFALYLTHQYISLTFIIPYFIDTLHINFWIATIFINLPIIVCIASFITFKIEIPYSKKMKKGLHNLYTKIAFFSEVSKV